MASIVSVQPFNLVIFGITGDLARRKLIQVLFSRYRAGELPSGSRIIGVSRIKMSLDAFHAMIVDVLVDSCHKKGNDRKSICDFAALFVYYQIDLVTDLGWDGLQHELNESKNRIRVYYLSVPPALVGSIVKKLAQLDLAEGARLIVEKPFGHDLHSARKLKLQIGKVFAEDHIYRIDHYLGKESVQNLMALRFANSLFEPLWNNRYIEHIQITAAETLGVEGRGEYYDQAGAMRDMVQNHLLQLLCLTAMEPPHHFHADAIRDEKLKILRALRPFTMQDALRNSVRGQYLGSKDKQGYLAEVGHSESNTPSFVALIAYIDSWRWAGIPFYMRTGKRMRCDIAEIVVTFRHNMHSIFAQLDTPIQANQLHIRLQPKEGLTMHIMAKDPDLSSFKLRSVPLDMTGSSVKEHVSDAYERLMMDVIRGDQTLFMRADEVEAAWEWIDPIISAWGRSGIAPDNYDTHSAGPLSAVEMLARKGHRWRELIV